MKILYVKNNSERAKELQLKTIIYEENGQKYVKKQASTKEAIPHLKKMKKSYELLSDAIINPKIKLAKIIDESEESLTFEFISGVSLEKKFYDAIKVGENAIHTLIEEYLDLLHNGFKTHSFDSSTVDKAFRSKFGFNDYKHFDNQLTFSGVSNIDLIFSNILYKDDSIYLIDYEWVFELDIPINFIVFRQFENFIFPDSIRKKIYDDLDISLYKNLYSTMNTNFIMGYITNKESFYQYSQNFRKYNPNYLQVIQQQDATIQEMKSMDQKLIETQAIIAHKDKHIQEIQVELHNVVEKCRLKNMPKRVIKKLLKTIQKEDDDDVLPDVVETSPQSEEETTPEVAAKTYSYTNPTLTDEIQISLSNFAYQPLISIVMPVYNVDPKWLKLAIESIQHQWYTNWELCIADDKSPNQDIIDYLHTIDDPKIKITFLDTNQNISGATNAAIGLASGEYIALMDNDDELTPDALYEMVKAVNEQDAEFIYSDEDFISVEGECSNPHFKPDFSPDLLLSHNYITHFTCFKKSLLDMVGPFDSKYDGAQDFDLFLRLTEKTSKIHHVQKVLYHWRTLPSSTSSDSTVKPEALNRGKEALESALQRREISAVVEHGNLNHFFRVKYDIKNDPLVSIIIPFKDKPELLRMCVDSIIQKSTYGHFEIIGISNNSSEEETFELMKELEASDVRVSFYEYNIEFNYSQINNYAVETYAKGDHIILLNNDIEIISPHWIESMLELSQRENTGCVGAKLYYPNDTIQHAGIIIGLGGYAGHSHKHYVRNSPGYFNRLNVIQNLAAVTAACLMIKKSIYQEVGGLNENDFKVAYNDVDFCLRVLDKGYLNLFTPYAEAYHHESVSRGYETTPEKIARFNSEKAALRKQHHHILTHGDPYYNPGLTLDKEDFGLCLR